jgi:hypothetical protein
MITEKQIAIDLVLVQLLIVQIPQSLAQFVTSAMGYRLLENEYDE